jgi:RNA polymerase sigma-70 factor (ECF subfamily)
VTTKHRKWEGMLSEARAGDRTALGRLLDAYRSYLTLLARIQLGRRLKGKVSPSDLVQETFLEAYRDFGHFRGLSEKELLAWLRRMLAANLADQVKRYRLSQRRDVRLERQLSVELKRSSEALEWALASLSSAPGRRAERRELAIRLANALERLPADYRQVLLLRHFQGRSFADVADELGRSVDSVKNLWLRALARLRPMMEEPG